MPKFGQLDFFKLSLIKTIYILHRLCYNLLYNLAVYIVLSVQYNIIPIMYLPPLLAVFFIL